MKKKTNPFVLHFRAFAFLCIILLFMQMSNAQPYSSIFGNEKTEFAIFVPFTYAKSLIYGEYDSELGEGGTEYLSFTKGNDTIINGNTYQKLDNYDYYFACVREDTITGKIYTYDSRFEEEFLVCDFSLDIGDTFHLHNIPIMFPGPLEFHHGFMIADSIAYSDGKKVIYFGDVFIDGNPTDLVRYPNKVFFMEGIGSIFGPISYKDANGPKLKILLCVHKDENLVYNRNPNSSYGCYYQYGSGIDEHQKSKLNLFPNPTTDRFIIKNEELKITHVQIVDLLGKIVIDMIPQNETEIILDISRLHSGLYVVIANTSGGIITEKIMKM